MAVDHIRYDLLTQDALRGVVRRVLQDVAREGLPGEHHFFISFDTRAPGVRLSQRMREKYPAEMTIVLQHQFWDLSVTDYGFQVGLSFAGIPETLQVPFSALKGFFDPSVQFGLQFEIDGEAPAEAPALAAPAATAARGTREPPARATRGAASEPAIANPEDEAAERVPEPKPARQAVPSTRAPKPAEPAAPAAASDAPPEQDVGATVVRLDSFRKK